MSEEHKLTTTELVAAVDHVQAPPEPKRPLADAPHPGDETSAPLFVRGDADGYRTRWSAIQAGFVDQPRQAVEEADGLVAEVVKRLAEVFAYERGRLEGIWERNDQVSTEDLRQLMRRYRSFFERLLTV